MSRPWVPGDAGVTRCVTNSKDCSAAAFGERIQARRGAGNCVRVGGGSGLRGVWGESALAALWLVWERLSKLTFR